MTNNYGASTKQYVTSDGSDDWDKIVARTVDNDNSGLNDALNNVTGGSSYTGRQLDLNSGIWGGMQSGAIKYDSTQTADWASTIPSKYKDAAEKWENQRGMIKITPLQQRQKFTYATIAYIATKQEEPKTQIFPISDVSVVPHQITFDFYDTTEGRVGVSNAVEKHMTVEFDVYLTDLVATWWAFGGDGEYNYGLDTFPNLKKHFWDAIHNNRYLDFKNYDVEATGLFAEFRNTFLQQHSGWICRFTSNAFGVFQGVITDVNYDIASGESFAKWHVKLEEAIFMDDTYSLTGQKQESTETSSDGSTSNSGSATSSSDVSDAEDSQDDSTTE